MRILTKSIYIYIVKLYWRYYSYDIKKCLQQFHTVPNKWWTSSRSDKMTNEVTELIYRRRMRRKLILSIQLTSSSPHLLLKRTSLWLMNHSIENKGSKLWQSNSIWGDVTNSTWEDVEIFLFNRLLDIFYRNTLTITWLTGHIYYI